MSVGGGPPAPPSPARAREGDELHGRDFVAGGELQRGGERYVDTTVVGRWQADRTLVKDDLRDRCREATHFVVAADVGAFAHFGGYARFLGATVGGASDADHVTLSQAGDASACLKARASDWSPPTGCSVPLRVELETMADVKCAKREKWNGSACAKDGGSLLPFFGLLLLGAG